MQKPTKWIKRKLRSRHKRRLKATIAKEAKARYQRKQTYNARKIPK